MYRNKFMLGISLLDLHAMNSIEQHHSTPTPPHPHTPTPYSPPFPFVLHLYACVNDKVESCTTLLCFLVADARAPLLSLGAHLPVSYTKNYRFSALSCRQKVAYKLVYVFFCYRLRKLQIYRFFI